MDFRFAADHYLCSLRTAGILIHQGSILLQRDADGDEYALPGGHVRVGENTQDALLREYREETGADIRIQRLVWTEECFWQWQDRQVHHLCFYYLIDLCEGVSIPFDGRMHPQKDHPSVVWGWISLDRLGSLTVYPEFLKTEIRQLSDSPRHFITYA